MNRALFREGLLLSEGSETDLLIRVDWLFGTLSNSLFSYELFSLVYVCVWPVQCKYSTKSVLLSCTLAAQNDRE